MLSTKFRVKWPFGSGEEAKNRFYIFKMAASSHLGFPIGTIITIFDLKVIPMLPTKFRINWPFGSREEKDRFSRWPPWRPSLISDQNEFCFFYLQITPMLPTKFRVNMPKL